MTDVENAIRAQLETMLPKSIDGIVRLHREEICIRIATPDDLAQLMSDSMPICMGCSHTMYALVHLPFGLAVRGVIGGA